MAVRVHATTCTCPCTLIHFFNQAEVLLYIEVFLSCFYSLLKFEQAPREMEEANISLLVSVSTTEDFMEKRRVKMLKCGEKTLLEP